MGRPNTFGDLVSLALPGVAPIADRLEREGWLKRLVEETELWLEPEGAIPLIFLSTVMLTNLSGPVSSSTTLLWWTTLALILARNQVGSITLFLYVRFS